MPQAEVALLQWKWLLIIKHVVRQPNHRGTDSQRSEQQHPSSPKQAIGIFLDAQSIGSVRFDLVKIALAIWTTGYEIAGDAYNFRQGTNQVL